MINIEKFIKIRKSLKLSQNELCNGICTQSTLSKFENNGQIPSFKILKQLCERMNISLSDIMLTSTESEIAPLWSVLRPLFSYRPCRTPVRIAYMIFSRLRLPFIVT